MTDRVLQVLLFADESGYPLPRWMVTTTARKGDKWAKLVVPGDVVQLAFTSNPEASIGAAAIVDVEQVTHEEVLATAKDNHGLNHPDQVIPASDAGCAEAMAAGLREVYGRSEPGDLFTKLYLLPLNIE